MRKNLTRVVWLVVLALACLAPAAVQAQDLVGELDRLAQQAQAAADDPTAQPAAYDAIHESWESIEDAVRDQAPTLYVELESALDAVKDALAVSPQDGNQVAQSFTHLAFELREGAETFEAGPVEDAALDATPAAMQNELAQTLAALQAREMDEAAEHIDTAIRMWPTIEGAIAAKSQQDYDTIEHALGAAMSARAATPLDAAMLQQAVTSIQTTLAPYLAGQSYTALDAAAIIIREGLEALLVIVALLTFLRKSGSATQARWVWIGAGAGVVASIVIAFALQTVFSQISAGRNREIIEGVTGIVAAGLLFYVSYWLHSKANLAAWQRYIRTQTTQALARGSLFGVAALAFLAVFREGAETTIFYLGMAPSIQPQALLTGLGIGVAVLAVVAVVMVIGSVRLPLRPFFQVAGLLVYYLGFKFLGTGIHALQVAGVLPSSPLPYLPEATWIGVYATWESFVPQLLLLAATVAVWWLSRAWSRSTGGSPALS